MAYDVLSKPNLRRVYDARPPSAAFDVFATRPMGHAEETFRGVVLGVFNDFLDGDLEVIRTLLSMYSLHFFGHSLSTIFLSFAILLAFDMKSMIDRLVILFCVLQKRSTTSTRPSSSARRALTRCSLRSRPSERGRSVRGFYLPPGLPFPSIS